MKALLLLLVLAFSAFPQTNSSKKYVFWSKDEKCLDTNLTIGPNDFLKCDSIVSNGQLVKIVFYNGLLVAATFSEDGNNIVADMFIGNETGQRILVDPTRWGVMHYNSKEDFNAGKPSKDSALATSPAKIARKIRSRMAWANAFSSMGAAFATQTATVNTTTTGNAAVYGSGGSATGTYNSNSQSTVTAPDYAAQNRVANTNAQRSVAAARQADNILYTALLPNTVFDKSKIGGLVYFNRSKKAKISTVFVRIEFLDVAFDLQPESK